MISRRNFFLFYMFVAAIEIVAETYELIILVYIFKPLLVISLLLFFLSHVREILFPVALIFALSGDIFLMIRGHDLFIPGLASFLVMQWLYSRIFWNYRTESPAGVGALLKLLPLLAYVTGLFALIFPHLNDTFLRVAVAIYALSIAGMTWTASLALDQKGFTWVLAGAGLFMISDSIIAIGRFLEPIPAQSVWVMSTYAGAQFLITMGILETKKAGKSRL